MDKVVARVLRGGECGEMSVGYHGFGDVPVAMVGYLVQNIRDRDVETSK